ncbi:TetR/AcrR family transcriptional regulator [Corynebacterium endometrii]|uniref:Transcriptional regulator, TetR family n=1 Tax=Corynebacterium endometrii TaxID=2488819 RepID=A0A4V1CEV8_9CORY|nr:TetR/AcrR family transcriptional regulator [Corynebacterium endometrii]QCB29458.1 Transcriptional regulator, TetR family [Corynebacterium endometrii]
MSRRDDIVAAARKIAVTEGVEAISVRRVAAAAGIGASTLRYYFPTIKDLFSALASGNLDDYLSSEGLEDASVPAVDRLTGLLMQFLPPNDDGVGQLETVLSVHQAAFESGKLVGSDALRDLNESGEAIVTGWLMKLREQGATLSIDPGEGARLLLAMTNGLALELIARAPGFTINDARQRLGLLVRLIVSEEK